MITRTFFSHISSEQFWMLKWYFVILSYQKQSDELENRECSGFIAFELLVGSIEQDIKCLKILSMLFI